MREIASERSKRYVEITTSSLKRWKIKKMPATVEEPTVRRVLEMAKGYVNDAKHYAKNRKPVTSLACVSYAEGLLDAMKFLELAEF